jgi:large conductance mechanosensitive channel protein
VKSALTVAALGLLAVVVLPVLASPAASHLPRSALSKGAAPPTPKPTRASAPTGPKLASLRPQIHQWPIPFTHARKQQMAAYSQLHYGEDTYVLSHPKVIVEHYTETATAQEAYNTFAPDVPDSEFHELPNTCAHFLVEPNGRIDQLVPLTLRCRHTVGLNWTAIGIENVGFSDREILDDGTQMASSLRLTRWLRCTYGIAEERDRPQREPLIAVSPRARPVVSAPDALGLEPRGHARLPHAAGAAEVPGGSRGDNYARPNQRTRHRRNVMAKEFKAFLLRGNVVDLAVGIVIGAAFGAVVTALVRDLITPIIAAIIGKPDFSNLMFTINGSAFHYGDFINVLIAFLSIAAAVFFFVVKPVNALMQRRKTGRDVESETRPCGECLSEIPREARKCAFCASPQPAAA